MFGTMSWCCIFYVVYFTVGLLCKTPRTSQLPECECTLKDGNFSSAGYRFRLAQMIKVMMMIGDGYFFQEELAVIFWI